MESIFCPLIAANRETAVLLLIYTVVNIVPCLNIYFFYLLWLLTDKFAKMTNNSEF